MNYLQSLRIGKEAREEWEKEATRYKEIVFQMEGLRAAYDGHFTSELEKFLEKYKKSKKK